jgi:26S proteasome regulatory subunit N2
VKKLLHFSVSDVSDDVRRAAVMSLGLVLSNDPARVPKVLKLLSQSYNPHVRYGACMAIGIGCPGMAASVPESLTLLEPLMNDVSEFVRQGALIAMGLVCQETSAKQAGGKTKNFREKINKMIKDKHEDIMSRLGAVLAHGLIDIGGRNASVPLMTKNGSLRMGAAVGFCLFAQMWYWYPLMLMLSLATTPTALIALNKNLKMPKNFQVKSKAKPSTFAFPPEFKVESKEAKARLTSAVLSAAKGKKLPEAAKDVEMTEEQPSHKPEEETPEPFEETLSNPCRVVAPQEPFVAFFAPEEGARYMPILPSRKSGFIVVRDMKPGEPEEFLEFGNIPDENLPPATTTTAPASAPTTSEEEAPPPEAFEWEG